MKLVKRKMQSLYRVLKMTILVCVFSLFTYTDQDTIPPMLRRPDESNSSHKEVTVEVRAFKVTQKSGDTVIIPSQNEDETSLIKGKDAVSFITSILGLSGIEEVFRETQQIADTYDYGNHFKILPELNFYVKKLEGDGSSGIYTLQTRVTIKNDEHEVDAIRATAKAQLGEPLVFSGIEMNTEKYIILATLQQRSNEKSNQNVDSSSKENEQEPEKGENQEPKPLEEQDSKESSDREQNDQKDKKESQQILLLLESLEDTDQQEQKEMLNRREKIQLEEKWW